MSYLKEIAKKEKVGLPANVKELTKFILVGREKLVSVRAEIRAINKIGLAKKVREQKLGEGQMLADALLDAETRMGEILKEVEHRGGTSSGGSSHPLPEGITHKQSHFFQTLADNKDIVEQVKAEARENEDFATRSEVLRIAKEKNIEKRNNEIKNKKIKFPDGKYGIIYADPPWEYQAVQQMDGNISSSAKHHYPTMSIDEISSLCVSEMADENCTLFIWTTSPILEKCFPVINAWGFSYRASFVWDKVRHNVGHYNSVRHEFLLIAVKGKGTPENVQLFDSVQSIEKTKAHSEKPNEFRKIIETLYPDRKKIELFARVKTDGWDVWGNQL